MGQAVFAKYHKGLKLSKAEEAIKHLLSSGASPIKYSVYSEHTCTHEEIQLLFEKGCIHDIGSIANQGVYSVSDSFGIWQCIKLISISETLLIFTAGASEIMYYSFL